jgi:DNA polymerase-1
VPDSPITLPSAPRLFLVDGYALIYRAFFALINRPLVTRRGENTSIAWGIANFLKRLLGTHRPEYLVWVHDAGASFRDTLYPEYKATREKLADDLQADFDTGLERVQQLLRAYDIPILAVEGYEADDVIGTLARLGVEAGFDVVIVSGDKDFHQLVQPHVWLLNPGRGGPAAVDEQWVGMDNASARLGVPPERVVDYLALVGDSSDNVPGVKGIGEKGAVELITQFGALEDILAQVAAITKKRPREALAQQADAARLSKTLVTIHTDVPVTFDRERFALSEPDRTALRALYQELEFSSLLRDLGADTAGAGAGGSGAGAATSSDPVRATGGPAADAGTVPASAPAASHPPAVPMQVGPSGVPVRADATFATADTLEAVAHVIARARATGRLAFDTETVIDADAPIAVDPLRCTLVGLSIAVAPGEAWYLPFAHRAYDGAGNLALLSGDAGLAGQRLQQAPPPPVNLPPLGSEAMAPLRALLADPAVRKVAQHAKYDLLVLRSIGVPVAGLDFDTMLASYILDPGRRSHGIDQLAFERLGHAMTSYEQLCGKGRGQLPFDVVPVDVARDYSCEDVDVTWRLMEDMAPALEASGMRALFDDIEVPLVAVLADMEWHGIAIDLDWFASLKARFQRERERVEQEIYAAAGETFNINSNPQLRTILFEKMGLPVKKKTATGPSTDASVLQELADEGHEIPTLLMEYRELAKLESTYVDTLPRLVHPRDQRLHTSYNQTVAATGRLSSSDPNLQNIPIRRELGRDIRRGFVPAPGARLVSADYSQIELRLLAHLSGDPAFVEAFLAGGDIHKQTAAVIFGVDVADVTSDMRARAKTINFATIYGQGPFALARQLKITQAEAKAFIETYFARFAGVKAFLDRCVVEAKERGYVETLFKRRRWVPELKDRNFNVRAFGERVAANAPIQGSAADLIKIAMLRIHAALPAEVPSARMLLQVHDELVFEVPAADVDPLAALVRREMEGAAALAVPLVVDVGVGENWLASKG